MTSIHLLQIIFSLDKDKNYLFIRPNKFVLYPNNFGPIVHFAQMHMYLCVNVDLTAIHPPNNRFHIFGDASGVFG